MSSGVRFEATRAAIALLGLPADAERRVLEAVAFDEGCVAQKLAESESVAPAPQPDRIALPFDGGDDQ